MQRRCQSVKYTPTKHIWAFLPCVLQEANTRVLSVSSSLTEIEATFRDAYEQAIINTFASYVLNLLGSVNECVTK